MHVPPSTFMSNIPRRKNYAKTDNTTFKALASIALGTISIPLARVGAYLSTIVDDAR